MLHLYWPHLIAGRWPLKGVKADEYAAVEDRLGTLRALLATAWPSRDDGSLVLEELGNLTRWSPSSAPTGARWVTGRSRPFRRTSARMADARPVIAGHERLWLARNRPGGLTDSLARLRHLLHCYETGEVDFTWNGPHPEGQSQAEEAFGAQGGGGRRASTSRVVGLCIFFPAHLTRLRFGHSASMTSSSGSIGVRHRAHVLERVVRHFLPVVLVESATVASRSSTPAGRRTRNRRGPWRRLRPRRSRWRGFGDGDPASGAALRAVSALVRDFRRITPPLNSKPDREQAHEVPT